MDQSYPVAEHVNVVATAEGTASLIRRLVIRARSIAVRHFRAAFPPLSFHLLHVQDSKDSPCPRWTFCAEVWGAVLRMKETASPLLFFSMHDRYLARDGRRSFDVARFPCVRYHD